MLADVVGDPVEGIIARPEVVDHRREGIHGKGNIWQDAPCVTDFSPSTGVEDLRQAIGQDGSPLAFTQGMVVDTLDTAPAGDVVLRRGELDRPVVGELHGRLH